MEKQYGLILPGQAKKSISTRSREVAKPTVFDESSDSNDDEKFYEPQKTQKEAPMTMLERRNARRLQEKALEEDPTVFQYDELYDEMASKREDVKQKKSNEPKKPKYIGRLMEFAERRKLENEMRIERQVQKEREEEGEEFKDKEAFVTEAYRKKLEERKILEQQDKRDEYLEAIGDVTKQKDLDGFYRHLYEQKLGTEKEVKKPELAPLENKEDNNEISYKPIKSGRPKQRAYRKRHSSDDDEEEAPVETKKIHLQNNIDADSDFSIDSSDSSDDEDKNGKDDPKSKKDIKNIEKQNSNSDKTDTTKIAINLDALKKETNSSEKEEPIKTEKTQMPPPMVPTEATKPKIDKSKIWEKRTVGAVFESAVQRYFERKAARSA